MYIENVVVGKPIVNEYQIFAIDINDWEKNEKEKTLYTDERYLPKIMVDCGIVKSISEVRRNKPQLCIVLNSLDFIELKWGKRKLWIIVGN